MLICRYSKRDIGRLFVDINAKDMSQEYGGLELVRDKNGFMAFNCELIGISPLMSKGCLQPAVLPTRFTDVLLPQSRA